MTLSSGHLLHDRYQVEALLGQGGMGAVYKAWDTSLNIRVAVKENLDTNLEAQKQFSREAHILASLSHPNLPRVIDHFFIPDQGQYLVMDYIDGEDLQSMLRRLGVLPEPQVLIWISQICDALAYLHSQPNPIIHRDIKPANIRIRPDGRAVLVDFGIAKIFESSIGTTVGAKAVTPGYSPPEQYGGSGSTDARSDIYALGATLYHLLSGQKPPESVQRLVNQAAMQPIRRFNQQVSPQVEQAVLRATEVATDRRFQSVDELRAALNSPAPPSPAGSQATQFAPAGPLATPLAREHPSSHPPAQSSSALAPKKVLTPVAYFGIGILVLGLLAGGGALVWLGSQFLSPSKSATPTPHVDLPATQGLSAADFTQPAQPTLPPGNPPPTQQTAVPLANIQPLLGQNMLENASFEHDPGTTSPYWLADALTSDMSSSWSTERILSGQHALFMSTSRTKNDDWPGWFSTIPVSMEYQYGFDAHYFTPDGAGAILTVDFLNQAGDTLHTMSTDCTPPKTLTTWRSLQMSIAKTDFPQGTQKMRLGLRQCTTYSGFKRTTLFFDDVSLIPAQP
jgi:serine/threonine protein kinase